MNPVEKRNTQAGRLTQCAVCAAAAAAIPVHSIQYFEEAEAPEAEG